MRTFLVCYCLLAAALLPAGTVSVVVDTDAGSDDLLAIAFLLARPDVRIEAINVVHGLAHVPHGAENVRRLLVVAGRNDIPVNRGREEPLQKTAEFPAAWRTTADNLLAGVPAPKTGPAPGDAASYYRSHAFNGTTILALGPLTNLAAAIQAGAHFPEILLMGGAVRVPGNLGDGGYFQTTNKTAEWNFFCDPQAAQVVFESGARIRMVPLDATNDVPLGLPFLEECRRQARSPLATAVAHLLEKDREVIAHGIYYAWDPLAAVALVDPQVARWESLPIRPTEPTPHGGVPVSAALHADPGRFRSLFLAAFR